MDREGERTAEVATMANICTRVGTAACWILSRQAGNLNSKPLSLPFGDGRYRSFRDVDEAIIMAEKDEHYKNMECNSGSNGGDSICFEEKLAILTYIGLSPGQTVDRVAEELQFDSVREKVEQLIDVGLVEIGRKEDSGLHLTNEGLHVVCNAANGIGPVFNGEGTF